jgi:hypothetical protein
VGKHRSAWFGSPSAKVLWFLVVSPLVCVAAGSVVGAAAFAGAAVTTGVSASVLRGYPLLVLYTLPITVPFGGAAGVVAALLIGRLGVTSFRTAALARWLRAGSGVGAAFGAACPAFLMLIGFGGARLSEWLFYVLTGAASGAAAGAVLGAMAWREFSRPTEAVGEPWRMQE